MCQSRVPTRGKLLSHGNRHHQEQVAVALSAEAKLPAQQKLEAQPKQQELIAAGQKLLNSSDHCASCHHFRGKVDWSMKEDTYPDLEGYGSREWLLEFIANPGHARFYNTNNDRMPAFAGDPKTGTPRDGIPFHPYYTVKDAVGVVVFLAVFSAIVFFAPEMGGYFLEAPNFIQADPLKTPEHIAPVWYFTPFYAMLRAVPSMFGSQFPGVAVMGAATLILFLLPWLDRGKVRSVRYRGPIYKRFLTAFVISFLVLGYLGVVPTTVWGQLPKGLPLIGGGDVATIVARVLTAVYFAFFILMPWYTKVDKEKPEPERVTF